jgi:hypothetical protein
VITKFFINPHTLHAEAIRVSICYLQAGAKVRASVFRKKLRILQDHAKKGHLAGWFIDDAVRYKWVKSLETSADT